MEFNSNKSIYFQIADLICENILLEKYKEGERLVSVREMAADLEVNPNTVMRAYSFLQDEEVIFNKRGIGYFISDEGKELVLGLKKESFIKDVLPGVFKECSLYGIDADMLNELYSNSLKGDSSEVK